jgi:hypothetical protein
LLSKAALIASYNSITAMLEPLSRSTPNGSKAVPLFYEKSGLTSSPAKKKPNQKMLVPFPFITHQALL